MNQKNMETLIKLLRDDMKPALGVTEPGAIAFAAAKAREFVKGDVERVDVDHSCKGGAEFGHV